MPSEFFSYFVTAEHPAGGAVHLATGHGPAFGPFLASHFAAEGNKGRSDGGMEAWMNGVGELMDIVLKKC